MSGLRSFGCLARSTTLRPPLMWFAMPAGLANLFGHPESGLNELDRFGLTHRSTIDVPQFVRPVILQHGEYSGRQMTHHGAHSLQVSFTMVDHLPIIQIGELRIVSPGNVSGLVECPFHHCRTCLGHSQALALTIRRLVRPRHDARLVRES